MRGSEQLKNCLPANIAEKRGWAGTTFPIVAPEPRYQGSQWIDYLQQSYQMSAQVVTVLLDEKGVVRYYRRRLYPQELGEALFELIK